jgi:DNA-binding NtrC family response regulator
LFSIRFRPEAGVDREVSMTQESLVQSAVQSIVQSLMPPVMRPAPPVAHSLAPNEIVPLLIGSTVEEIERELILQTLARCDGNRTRAARVLGMSVRTLRNKIRLYAAEGIEVPAHGE